MGLCIGVLQTLHSYSISTVRAWHCEQRKQKDNGLRWLWNTYLICEIEKEVSEDDDHHEVNSDYAKGNCYSYSSKQDVHVNQRWNTAVLVTAMLSAENSMFIYSS